MFIVVIISVLITLLLISFFRNNGSNLRIGRIKQFIQPNDIVLDLGCGSCCLGTQLSGVKVINMDIVNKSKCGAPIIYDGHKIPLPNKSVDISICAFVLHHTNNQIELLSELSRVTKRVILIFEDTPEYKIDDLFTNFHGGSHWGKGSFHCNETWEKIFNRLGMKVILNDRIGRIYPFSDRPWFYPVPKRMYVLN